AEFCGFRLGDYFDSKEGQRLQFGWESLAAHLGSNHTTHLAVFPHPLSTSGRDRPGSRHSQYDKP
ncbi:MAG: hypothetical protein ABGZ17_31345, partial [Planctomycetaceae bacterium]